MTEQQTWLREKNILKIKFLKHTKRVKETF